MKWVQTTCLILSFGFLASTQAAELNSLVCINTKTKALEVSLKKNGTSYAFSKQIPNLKITECFVSDDLAPLISCRGTLNGNIVKLKSILKIEESLEVERDSADKATGVVSREAKKDKLDFELSRLLSVDSTGDKDWQKLEAFELDFKLKNTDCEVK